MAATTTRFPALDGLRIVGALAVMMTHIGFASGAAVAGPWAGVLTRLDAGVALFFVVSGFLLYRPYVEARLGGHPGPPVGGYLRNRALRILPVLWIAVMAAALLVTPRVGFVDYLRVATLTQIYGPFAQTSIPGLTQLWSLATEVTFYLALPAIAWALAKGPGHRQPDRSRAQSAWVRQTLAILASSVLVSVGWLLLLFGRSDVTYNLWLPAYLDWFAAGMALALWRSARVHGLLGRGWVDDLAAHPGTAWAIAGALYLALATPLLGPYGLTPQSTAEAVAKNLTYGVLGVLIVLPTVAAEHVESAALAALGGPAGRLLGDISYGVFAYHLVVLSVVERLTGARTFGGGFLALLIFVAPTTLLLAWLSRRFVERPIMARLRARRAGSAVPVGEVAQPAARSTVPVESAALGIGTR